MESRHCGQDKRIFFCPVHNASTLCSLQAFGIRCITTIRLSFVNIVLTSHRMIVVVILFLLVNSDLHKPLLHQKTNKSSGRTNRLM